MLKNKSENNQYYISCSHNSIIGQANYTASKAGIVAMSKSLAIEYAKKLNANCISPDLLTAMTDKIDDKFKVL